MTENPDASTVLRLFKRLSRDQQLSVAEKINKQTLRDRWEELDERLPDIAVSEDEIMQEIKAVRYGKKKED